MTHRLTMIMVSRWQKRILLTLDDHHWVKMSLSEALFRRVFMVLSPGRPSVLDTL